VRSEEYCSSGNCVVNVAFAAEFECSSMRARWAGRGNGEISFATKRQSRGPLRYSDRNQIALQGARPMIRSVILPVLLLAASVARTQSVYIEDLTWPEVRDAIASGKTSAIIYAGSTEQNGPHLALGKHTFIAHYVAGRVAEELGDALVYPTMPFAPTGDFILKTGHLRFPGSVSVSSEVFLGVVSQVALSAINAGFKQVYLMGDHGGGQSELKLAAENLDREWSVKGVRVRYVPDPYFKEKTQSEQFLKDRHIVADEHAGTDDTSQIMFLDTAHKWVRADKLAVSDSTMEPSTGVLGDPTKATAEMGKVFLDFKVNDAVAQIRALRTSKP
jgi:creatinine amidohydrolase